MSPEKVCKVKSIATTFFSRSYFIGKSPGVSIRLDSISILPVDRIFPSSSSLSTRFVFLYRSTLFFFFSLIESYRDALKKKREKKETRAVNGK